MSDSGRVRRFFEFVNRRIGRVAAGLVLMAVVLGVVGPLVANEESANFSPTGDIYDIAERAEDVFESSSPDRGSSCHHRASQRRRRAHPGFAPSLEAAVRPAALGHP